MYVQSNSVWRSRCVYTSSSTLTVSYHFIARQPFYRNLSSSTTMETCLVFHMKDRIFCLILINIGIPLQIFIKGSSSKFNGNMSSESNDVTHGQRERLDYGHD